MSATVKKVMVAKEQLSIAEKALMKAEKKQQMTVAKTSRAVEAARAKVNKSKENFSFLNDLANSNVGNASRSMRGVHNKSNSGINNASNQGMAHSSAGSSVGNASRSQLGVQGKSNSKTNNASA